MNSQIACFSILSNPSTKNLHPTITIPYKANGFINQTLTYAQNKFRIPNSWDDTGYG